MDEGAATLAGERGGGTIALPLLNTTVAFPKAPALRDSGALAGSGASTGTAAALMLATPPSKAHARPRRALFSDSPTRPLDDAMRTVRPIPRPSSSTELPTSFFQSHQRSFQTVL